MSNNYNKVGTNVDTDTDTNTIDTNTNASSSTRTRTPTGTSMGITRRHVVLLERLVLSIQPAAFKNCESIQSIVIPNTVTEIGEDAFYGCSSLQSIAIPPFVTNIENRTFQGCSSLVSIDLPSSITNIGRATFWRCSSLESITIPSSVTKIDVGAFVHCSSLASVSIAMPSSLTLIANAAFLACSSLESIHIPSSVTNIEHGAFKSCTSLKSIHIPTSLVRIRENAFQNCTSLESVIIPPSVQHIEKNAFEGCTSLTLVAIPNYTDVEVEIGRQVFKGCTRLEERQINGINYHTDTCTWLRRRFLNLPIHEACYNNTDTLVLLNLLSELMKDNNNKSTLTTADTMGMTALHILCCNPSVNANMIEMIKEASPPPEGGGATEINCNDNGIIHKSPLEFFLMCRNIILPSDTTTNNNNENDIIIPTLRDLLRQGINCNDLECLFALDEDCNKKLTSELWIRDKITGLFPFMLAASQSNYRLDMVYMLVADCSELALYY